MNNRPDKETQSNEIERETIINALIEDYGEYLEDFTLEELETISENGVFTL